MTVRVHSNFGSENSLLALPPVARSSVCRVTCTILHAAGSAAFPPILRGRSFDGTRDKWTARRGRAGTAPRLLAASPLKCNMLFVTELWPKSSAIEGEGRIYKRGRVASRLSPPLSTFSMYVWTDATKANLGTIKRLRGRGGFTVLLPYNTCTGLIFPKKEAAAL